MHNDSKLGMLAGVAGVVVAAVLFSQKPATEPGPTAQAAPGAPVAVSTPTNAGPIAKVPAASTPVAARSRPELEGKTTSRSTRDDDE